jgi:hypothetical protein
VAESRAKSRASKLARAASFTGSVVTSVGAWLVFLLGVLVLLGLVVDALGWVGGW